MLVVHGTRAFRDRVPGVEVASGEVSTTVLGPWYATLLPRRRPAALLVNEPTLLPLLIPLAPARTLLKRVPRAVAELLAGHRLPAPFIAATLHEAIDLCVASRGSGCLSVVFGAARELSPWRELAAVQDVQDRLLGLLTRN